MAKNQTEDFENPKEFIKVKRYFSEAEMDEMRKDQTSQQIELDEIEDEIKALKQSHAETIKQIKATTKGIRRDIRNTYTKEDRECELIPNYETGMMQYTDCETGEIHSERKLFPEEKQFHLSTKKAN